MAERRHGRFPRCRVLNHALASPTHEAGNRPPRSPQHPPTSASSPFTPSSSSTTSPIASASSCPVLACIHLPSPGCVSSPFSKLRRPIGQHSSCYGSTTHVQRSVSAGLAKDGHPWEHIPDSRLLISITRRTRGPPRLGSCSMPRPLCDMIGRPPPGTCNPVGICPEPVTRIISLEAFHPHIRSVSLPQQARFTSNSTLIPAI